MKKYSRKMTLTSFMVVLCTALFSFSANKGGDVAEIFINGKRVLQEFVHASKGVQNLELTGYSENDKMDIYYRHCGQVGTTRYITVKDDQGKALKVWKFPDAVKGQDAMSLTVKQIMSAKKNDGKLTLFYSSKEMPDGKVLANLIAKNNKSIATIKK